MKVRTSVLRGFALLALSTFAFTACDEKAETPIVVQPVTVTVTPSSAQLTVGQTTNFVAVVNNATNTAVTWASSTPAVATVNASTGAVTAVAPGQTTITATSTQDPNAKAAAQVIVVAAPPPPPVTIAVVPTQATMVQGQTLQLVPIVGGTTNTAVTYTTGDANVASVSATGLVTAVGPGTAVIRITSSADATKFTTSVITVTPGQPIVVTITPTQATGTVGQQVGFAASVSGTTNQAVNWTSTVPSVATVNAQGVATLLAPGTTVIRATSAANGAAVASATLTVEPVTTTPITVSIVPNQVTLAPGQTQAFAASSSAAGDVITYTSSNNNVVTVDANGVATAVAQGSAVITARSTQDPNRFAQAIVSVTAAPPVVITVNPTNIASLGTGASTQIVATITGTNNQNVVCSTANATVATVTTTADGRGCVVTGVAAGSTVITVASAADPSRVQTVPVTVVGSSVAIALITAPIVNAQGERVGPFAVNTNVSVPAGTADRLEIVLSGANGTFTFVCQQFTAAGAATTVACPINPADIDPNTAGAQVLPNGTYTVQARLMLGSTVAASATFGQPVVTGNVNTISGMVTFENQLADPDNQPDSNMDVDAAGAIWFGGDARVVVAPSVFTFQNGSLQQISSVDVYVDLNCNGTRDAGEPLRTANTANSFTVVFPENVVTVPAAGAGGIDNVEAAGVCFSIMNARDPNNVTVTTGGAGVTGAAGNISDVNSVAATSGPNQNRYNIDNVQPATPALPMAFDAADFDGLTTNVYFGLNGTARAGGANPNVLNVTGADGGVGGVTVTWFAVPSAEFAAGTGNGAAETQANIRTVTLASGIQFTDVNSLPETFTANGYVLVARVQDALNNTLWRGSAANAQFGVDLQGPTVGVVTAGGVSAPADAVNPGTMNIQFSVTDANSGAEGVTGSVSGYSVLETDADAGTELRCYNLAGAQVATPNAGAGPCPNFTTTAPTVTVGTEERYDVTIPGAENFYVFSFVSRDAAGNTSTTTITRQALVDVTAGPDAGTGLATVTINNYTIDNQNNTATVNGVVRDNIEVASTDARFRFTGLTTADGTDVPDAVPFTAPAAVGTYGLPLQAIQTVTATSQVNVDAIYTGSAAANANGANVPVDQFGFGMLDLANNFAFQGVAVPMGTVDGITLAGFSLGTSQATIDRTPAGGAAPPQTTTLTTVATVAPGASNPFVRSYIFMVHPGLDGVLGTGDEYNVLVQEFLGSSATMQTGETARTFAHSTSVNATSLPAAPAGTVFQFFAVGVASDGDAVISPVVNVTVNN